MVSLNYYGIILFLNFLWTDLSVGGDTNSHLFPPGSLGLNQVSDFNVTGPLNSFVEQIQANSRSQVQSQEIPQVQVQQLPQAQAQVPVIQIPSIPQSGSASVIYPQAQVPLQQPQPVIIGPQNRPAIDPALQQLLNSFNTNPAEAQRNTFIQAGPPDMNTPVVSYITCYVGCSHVTNIVTNSATKSYSINPTISIVFFAISLGILML